MFFGIKEKSIILTHTMYCLAIAININIPVILKTGSMLQGHIYELYLTILCIINISDKFTDYYSIYKALKG